MRPLVVRGPASGSMGRAALVGGQSVPQGWTHAAPEMGFRTLAAALPTNLAEAAVPEASLASQGGMFSQMAASSLAGRAVAATATQSVSSGARLPHSAASSRRRIPPQPPSSSSRRSKTDCDADPVVHQRARGIDMFSAAFPPEINSGRIYSGPGSGPMVAAATAWGGLADDLQSTAASYSSVISSLTSGPWLGPTSLSMAAAVAPSLSWMQGTAAQAAETAGQATAAASAYDDGIRRPRAGGGIAANRSQLASLVSTDIIGENNAAIAATETLYGEMWAQDALAMDTYAASSAAASKLTPYTEPPQTTNTAGTAARSRPPWLKPLPLRRGPALRRLRPQRPPQDRRCCNGWRTCPPTTRIP